MLPGDPDDQARLFYLVLLLVGLLAFLIVGQGHRLGRSLRDLAIWLLILAMVVIAYSFRDTLRMAVMPGAARLVEGGAVELRRGSDGHFHAVLDVNGHPLRFVVDTGASGIVLSRSDAAAVGIDPDALTFSGRALTANGSVATAPVRLAEVRFAEFTDRDVAAQVNGGALDQSLLGMEYLDRFARIEIEGDRMRLGR